MVGLPNNLRFLKRVIGEPIFQKGDYDTSYIDQNKEVLLKKDDSVEEFELLAATVVKIFTRGEGVNLPGELLNFRNVRNQSHKLHVSVNETHIKENMKYQLDYTARDGNSGVITLDGKAHSYSLIQKVKGVLDITIDDQLRKV